MEDFSTLDDLPPRELTTAEKVGRVVALSILLGLPALGTCAFIIDVVGEAAQKIPW